MSQHHTAALPPVTRYTTMAAKVLATETGDVTRTVVTVPSPEAATALAAALNGVAGALGPESLAEIVDAGHACVDSSGVSHLRQHLLGVFDGTSAADEPGTAASAAVARAARAVTEPAATPAVVRSVRDELGRLTAGLDDVLVVALVYIYGENEQRLVVNAALEQLSDDDVTALLEMPDAEDDDAPADWFDRQRRETAAALHRLSLEIDDTTDAGSMRYDEDDRLWVDFQIAGQWDDDLAPGLGSLRRWAARHRPHLERPQPSPYETEVTFTARVITDPGTDPVAVAGAALPDLVQAGPVVLDDLELTSAEPVQSDGDPAAAVTVAALAIVEALDRYEAAVLIRAAVTVAALSGTGDRSVDWDQVSVTDVAGPCRRR